MRAFYSAADPIGNATTLARTFPPLNVLAASYREPSTRWAELAKYRVFAPANGADAVGNSLDLFASGYPSIAGRRSGFQVNYGS